jgi:hypothetical protein
MSSPSFTVTGIRPSGRRELGGETRIPPTTTKACTGAAVRACPDVKGHWPPPRDANRSSSRSPDGGAVRSRRGSFPNVVTFRTIDRLSHSPMPKVWDVPQFTRLSPCGRNDGIKTKSSSPCPHCLAGLSEDPLTRDAKPLQGISDRIHDGGRRNGFPVRQARRLPSCVRPASWKLTPRFGGILPRAGQFSLACVTMETIDELAQCTPDLIRDLEGNG